MARVFAGAKEDMKWREKDELPATLGPIFDFIVSRYHIFAEASIYAAGKGEKLFELDLGYGLFVARSMKRLEKARMHVRDEILRSNCTNTVLSENDIMKFYLAEPKM